MSKANLNTVATVATVNTTAGAITFVRKPRSVLVCSRRALGTNITVRPTEDGRFEASWKWTGMKPWVTAKTFRTEEAAYKAAVKSVIRQSRAS